MDKIKLVAILRGIQPAEAADHIETLINAGFRYIEIRSTRRTGSKVFRRWCVSLASGR
ncbi:2-dehydro-3-deoxy-6-phosphogalactonate aldolase [Klebsiella pneumoniae]|uniref:2-dehydro-3-deoxy-6-phosphogalactonate aldolase n=1 Tax=Klebsiella pneumoniae TaxID=573 RepID=A0A2X3CZM4_KLEPN|nr:2-dehydro-3-deoxy-6-phosphogalactonate aldolase [Klebsiella pneumoniae]